MEDGEDDHNIVLLDRASSHHEAVDDNISQELQLTNMMEEDDEDIGLLDRARSHHEAVHSNSHIPKKESIDDMLRRLNAQQHLPAPEPKPLQNIYRNVGTEAVQHMLIERGFNKEFTVRAVVAYEKHYGNEEYDLAIVEDIIYRLATKDKVEQLKTVQNMLQSREEVHEILSSLNFSIRYINLAMLLYEVIADMFEFGKYRDNIYDVEFITELIMPLRSKFTDYGDLVKASDQREAGARGSIGGYEPTQSPESADVYVEGLQEPHEDHYRMVVNHRMMSMPSDGLFD
eukprot:176089_1